MARHSLSHFSHIRRSFCLLGGILLLCSSLAWAQTLDGPTQVVANPGGSFQYSVTFTPGPDPVYLAGEMFDGSDNTDQGVLIADTFCPPEQEPLKAFSHNISGSLVDITQPGKMIISLSLCSGEQFTLETTILPSPCDMADALVTTISGLPADAWRRTHQQQLFLRKAQRVKRLVGRKTRYDFLTAMALLQHDMLPKTDGQDVPHDWVIAPTSQQTLQEHLGKFIECLDAEMQLPPACSQ